MRSDLLFSMYLTVRKLGGEVTQEFANAGYDLLPEHFMILTFLSIKTQMNQNDIGRDTFKSKSTISRAIDKLVKSGYITRNACTNNRRTNCVELTEAGKSVYKKLLPIFLSIKKNALKGIPQNELDTCLRVIKKMISNTD